jgi:hypothetical protein
MAHKIQLGLQERQIKRRVKIRKLNMTKMKKKKRRKKKRLLRSLLKKWELKWGRLSLEKWAETLCSQRNK